MNENICVRGVVFRIFTFIFSQLKRERFEKSGMQYSSGPVMGVWEILLLLFRERGEKEIDVRGVEEKIKRGDRILLLDVRDEKSFRQSHVRDALNIPLRRFFQTDTLHVSKKTEIIVICYLGVTSREAAAHLRAFGYLNVANMIGGMGAWDYEEYKVVE